MSVALPADVQVVIDCPVPGVQLEWRNDPAAFSDIWGVPVESFHRGFTYSSSPEELRSRQAVLLRDGVAIGVGLAWRNLDPHGTEVGWVHSVKVAEQCRGLGLGRFLVKCILQRLQALGYTNAYLLVASVNYQAIDLYTYHFKFRPLLEDGAEVEQWENIINKMNFRRLQKLIHQRLTTFRSDIFFQEVFFPTNLLLPTSFPPQRWLLSNSTANSSFIFYLTGIKILCSLWASSCCVHGCFSQPQRPFEVCVCSHRSWGIFSCRPIRRKV